MWAPSHGGCSSAAEAPAGPRSQQPTATRSQRQPQRASPSRPPRYRSSAGFAASLPWPLNCIATAQPSRLAGSLWPSPRALVTVTHAIHSSCQHNKMHRIEICLSQSCLGKFASVPV